MLQNQVEEARSEALRVRTSGRKGVLFLYSCGDGFRLYSDVVGGDLDLLVIQTNCGPVS